MVHESIAMLGLKAKDRITGFEGVITSVSFDVPGCVMAVISPRSDKPGNLPEGKWFDVNRLEVSKVRVMDSPAKFAPTVREHASGPCDKPLR